VVTVIPRSNDNRARAKAGISRTIPASAELMRLYVDYLTREYGALDSDYVFVNLWAGPHGHPLAWILQYQEFPALVHGATSTSMPQSESARWLNYVSPASRT
jgi:hypothetical protein